LICDRYQTYKQIKSNFPQTIALGILPKNHATIFDIPVAVDEESLIPDG
jgi:hypothetical protein